MNETYTEIDLLDMLKTIFKNWKIIVAVTLIFTVLGGLYGIYLSKKEKPESAAEVKALTAQMTREEITQVEDAAKIITSYREMYNRQKEYNENSILQNLNPYSIKTLTLTYYVDNHYKVSYPVISEKNNIIPLVQTYVTLFDNEEMFEELSKVLEKEVSPSYLKELVSVDTKSADSGVFTVKIYANSNDLLQKISGYIKNMLNEKQNEIIEVYGAYDISLVSEVNSITVDSMLVDSQLANIDRLTKAESRIIDEEKLFSGDQSTYLKYLVHEEFEENVIIPKYVVVGLFVGFVMTVIVLAIKYLVDGTVKTEDELNALLKSKTIAKLSESFEIIKSRMYRLAEVNDVTRLAISVDDNHKELFKDLNDNIVLISTDFKSNNEEYKRLIKCDSIIFVGTLKQTKKKEILEDINLLKESKIDILGTIICE